MPKAAPSVAAGVLRLSVGPEALMVAHLKMAVCETIMSPSSLRNLATGGCHNERGGMGPRASSCQTVPELDEEQHMGRDYSELRLRRRRCEIAR
jgi:hypothetical protein